MFMGVADTAAVSESVGARFHRQAEATPDHLAIVSEKESVSYRDLSMAARQIAAGLASHQGEADEPIALLMKEGSLLYATMLAAASMGRIFIPLDPTSPAAWIADVIAKSSARTIIADTETYSDIRQALGAGRLVLQADILKRAAPLILQPASLPQVVPLCVLYTSGSTGIPKGVVLSHSCVLLRAELRRERYSMTPGDRYSQLRPSSYGAGFNDLISALVNGVTLVRYDLKARGLDGFSAWLEKNAVTGVFVSCSVLRAWLAVLPPTYRAANLRVVHAGGDALYGADVKQLSRHLQGPWRLIHQLSSTESSVMVERFFTASSTVEDGIVAVGRALDDVEVRLEDDNGNPVAAGEVGEIVVHSRHIGLGYWKDPELTSAQFGFDPGDPSIRIFRTRDQGRWREDGFLEHIGRKDRKIKLRGHSIELPAIERVLLALPGVRDAAVLVRETADHRNSLVAYVASDDHLSMRPRALRNQLFTTLPRQMVPSEIVVLPEFPLTPRGKADRGALPSPEEVRRRNTSHRKPADGLERQLAQIWCNVLKRTDIGLEDDFFVMGGDSLQATQLILEIEKSCGVGFPAEVMLSTASTIAGMAREIEMERAAERGRSQTVGQIDVDFAEFGARGGKTASAFFIDPRTALRRPMPNTTHGRVVFNSQGYRNPDIAQPKPAGKLRIAFLGASTTLDTFARDTASSWPHVLCDELRAKFPGADIDYLNAGMPGFNARQLKVLYKEYVAAFRPDIVVLWANDVTSNTTYLARREGLYKGAHYRPSALATAFRPWMTVEKNLIVAARLLRANFRAGKLAFSPSELTEDFEDRLEDLVGMCVGDGAVVALVATGGRLRRSQSRLARMRAAAGNVFFMPYMSIEGLLDVFDAVDEVVRRVGKRAGAAVVEPKDHIPGDRNHYVDSGHFRDAGSKRMASAAANALIAHPPFRALIASHQRQHSKTDG